MMTPRLAVAAEVLLCLAHPSPAISTDPPR